MLWGGVRLTQRNTNLHIDKQESNVLTQWNDITPRYEELTKNKFPCFFHRLETL